MSLFKSSTNVRRLLVVAFTLVACLSVIFVTTLSAQGPDTQDNANDQQGTGASVPADPGIIADALLKAPEDVLYDNGPLVNEPGGGPGGADGSVLQNSTLGMTTLGFGHQVSAGNRIADDFTITDTDGWQIDQITFYAYQTGSTTTSTITEVNYRVWDGPPGDPASNVVFGDTTTNRLINTTWSGIYRYSETTVDTSRPIMANTASAGFALDPGTYWLDWQTGGSLGSGPWAPPITIDGQVTTGNGLQYTGTWDPALDGGTVTQQGFPFIIEGTVGGGGPTPTPSPTSVGGDETLACNAAPVEFESGIPDSWNVVDNEGSGVVWTVTPDCGETNYTGGGGQAACASSDAFGPAPFDTELITNPIDLSDATSVTLDYLANYQNFAGLDYLDLDISTDGGATWDTLLSWNEDHGTFAGLPGEAVSVDLSAYAGETDVLLRWRYYDPNPGDDWDWYAEVDQIYLDCEGGPTPTPSATASATVSPTVTNTAVPPTITPTGPATSIQLSTLESHGSSNPWLLLSLVGIAGLAGAAWVGARRSR